MVTAAIRNEHTHFPIESKYDLGLTLISLVDVSNIRKRLRLWAFEQESQVKILVYHSKQAT